MKAPLIICLITILGCRASAQCNYFLSGYDYENGAFDFDIHDTSGAIIPGSIIWDFGDGTTDTGAYVYHQYNNSGKKLVCVHVTNVVCDTTICDSVQVNLNCKTKIWHSYDDSLYTLHAINVGVPPFTYNWEISALGQTMYFTVETPQVIPYSGANSVNVFVRDSEGCESAAYSNIYRINTGLTNCSTIMTHSGGAIANTPITVIALSNNPPTYNYWFMSGAELIQYQGPMSFDTTFSTPGTYEVCATTVDMDGCLSNNCMDINVAPQAGCNAYFEIYTDSAQSNGIYWGINQSSGQNLSYLWDFGDGNSSNLQYPNHNYQIPGLYNICLTVTDTVSNCSDTYCDSSFYVFKSESGLISQLIIVNPLGVDIIDAQTFITVLRRGSVLLISDKTFTEFSKVATLYDLMGNEISSITTNDSDMVMPLPDLQTGIYFLNITSNRTNTIKKIYLSN